jgi:hypothetical protein
MPWRKGAVLLVIMNKKSAAVPLLLDAAKTLPGAFGNMKRNQWLAGIVRDHFIAAEKGSYP